MARISIAVDYLKHHPRERLEAYEIRNAGFRNFIRCSGPQGRLPVICHPPDSLTLPDLTALQTIRAVASIEGPQVGYLNLWSESGPTALLNDLLATLPSDTEFHLDSAGGNSCESRRLANAIRQHRLNTMDSEENVPTRDEEHVVPRIVGTYPRSGREPCGRSNIQLLK